MYRPDNGYKVYDQKIRRSDSRDAMDYGRDFDFSKTFTENFRELSTLVPLPSMYSLSPENSDYCNCVSYQKSCYLTSASSVNENCMYAAYIINTNETIDSYMNFDCEYCYMAIDCEKSYKLIYASNCRNCTESYFLTNCRDCSFCRNCEWLENKMYCIDNIQYEKDAYLAKIVILKDIWYGDIYIQRKKRNQKDTILFSENSTGHHIRNSKNAIYCADVNNIENCKYCTWIYTAKECYDIYAWWENAEMCYESMAIWDGVYGTLFDLHISSASRDVMYSMHCSSSSHCFGCVWLRNKSYCIFNKQYTKEEYENLVAKIITHMQTTGERGEFFHPSLSPFGYNETVAMEYYPLEKAASGKLQAIRQQMWNLQLEAWNPNLFEEFGYHRSDYESPKPVSDKVIQWKDLPDTIEEVQDDILQYAIACEVTGKLFRIQPQELVFYRKHHIPLPHKHPDQRHLERLQLRR